jgi:peptide/nickel transport system permease protein
MTRFIIRRLLLSVLVLLGVTLITSGMLIISGDPVAIMVSGSGTASPEVAARLRHELGLDRPFLVQWLDFVFRAIQGDLGQSFRYGRPALGLVLERLPATIELTAAAIVFALSVALPAGVIAALKPRSLIDRLVMLVALSGQAIPSFWLGIMAVLVFAATLHWLPSGGRDGLNSLVLPTVTLGLVSMARVARLMRSSMLEVLNKDYIRVARSNGLGLRQIILSHAIQNAILPVITVVGLQVGVLLGGAVVTETIFAWPGVGQLVIDAVSARDFPLVRAIVTVVAVVFIGVNLIVDILYAYVNPQIRY